MDRKLLPYEHQLVEALGITKEEYLAFVAVQQEYKDPKAGTEIDIRNDFGATALALTVVGVLFQVGAALLTPKPKIPSLPDQRNQARSREQRFAPTFGFNSVQELASYNDPVNLVYTNVANNPNGGIRISGALVWSAIESLGSAQFMQLLFIMGASKIRAIKPEFTAFGQVGLQDFDPALVWQFYKNNNGTAGPVLFNDIVFGYPSGKQNAGLAEKLQFLPQQLKRDYSGKKVCRVDSTKGINDGFSQVYTPTTATAFGAFDPVPIEIKYFSRDERGQVVDHTNGISIRYGNKNQWPVDGQGRINEGTTFLLTFGKVGTGNGDQEVLGPPTENTRRELLQSLNFGATYMLGTAKFVLESFNSQNNIDRGNVILTFRCIQSGVPPFTNYNNDEATDTNAPKRYPTRKELEEYLKILNADEEDPVNDTDAAYFNIPFLKQISNDPDVREDYSQRDIFIEWIDDRGKPKSTRLVVKGSIDFSRERAQKRALALNPRREAKEERKELKGYRDKINQYIDDIQGGEYDDVDRFQKFLLAAKRGIKPEDYDAGRGTVTLLFPAYNDRGEVDNSKPKKTAIDQTNGTSGWETSVRLQEERLAKNGSNGVFYTEAQIASFEKGIIRARNALRKAENTCTRLVRRYWIKDARREKPEKRNLEGVKNTVFFSTGQIPNKGQLNYGGLEFVEDLLAEVDPPDDQIQDQPGTDEVFQAYRSLIKDKKATKAALKYAIANYPERIKAVQNLKNQPNRLFYTKCLVKIENASYETVSEVDHVKFAIKAALFRRIQGRQQADYGEEQAPDGYRDFDNGVHDRIAFFRLAYKKVGDSTYEYFRNMFAIRRRSESDFYGQIDFQPENTGAARTRWQFRFEPVIDLFAINFTDCKCCVLSGSSNNKITIWENTNSTGHRFSFFGSLENGIDPETGYPNVIKEQPDYVYNLDMFANHTDNDTQFSHERGPEFLLTAVTEQQFATSNVENRGKNYSDLSTMAMIVRAGRGIQDLRNVTTFVTQGKDCFTAENFTAKQVGSSSYAPDIFVDTALDPLNGVGKYIPSGEAVLDQTSLKRAKNFCKNNNLPTENNNGRPINLFMDGVIADLTAWREFWVSNSAFSLLEFVRKNGKEALVPAIPANNDGRAANNDGSPVPIQISGLFTTGNILEGSYKEEFLDYGPTTQDLIATVVYREMDPESVFSKRTTVEVRRKGASSNTAITETFDASAFVTQREQAIMIGKLLVNQRRYILRGVEFKTFPTNNPIEPGEFVYVDVGNTTWDSYSSGIVLDGGVLNMPLYDVLASGTYQFLLYNPKSSAVKSLSAAVDSNKKASSLSSYTGWSFVMGSANPRKRVFRITEVALDEEGEVTVKAMEYPVYDNLGAKIADFRSSNFTVR